MMNAANIFPAVSLKERRLLGAILAADWSSGTKRVWDPALFYGIDWTKIPDLSWQYKIRPMMAAALREAGWPGVPAEIRAAVETAERKCAAKTMWQLTLLAAIAAEAARQNLRFIALKGVALSLRLYGDPFRREAFDLDFLPSPGDRARFHDIIRNHGCCALTSGAPLTPQQTAILRRYRHEDKFIHLPSGEIVESHNSLHHNQHLIKTDFEALWSARETVSLAGTCVAVMGEEDLVHNHIVHAARHCWERWKWLADLIALSRKADAARLSLWRQRAVRDGNADIFDSWLLLSAAVASYSLPQQALETAARNRRARALAKRALRLSARDRAPGMGESFGDTLAIHAYRLHLKPTARYLVVELAAALHRDRDWYAMRLPDRFIWMYYVLRPLLFVWRRCCAPLAAIVFRKTKGERSSQTGRI
jgi:hypothetical protein